VGKVKLICVICTCLFTDAKWWLDEGHSALLRRFASLALLYKTLDLLTYLGTAFLLSEPARCLFMEK